MARKLFMGLGTLNTILNTAPLIIQGATKLIRILKEKGGPGNDRDDVPATLDGLKKEIQKIHARLDANNDSDIEQIKLIGELAKQNELLAGSLKRSVRQLNIISLLAAAALGLAAFLAFYS